MSIEFFHNRISLTLAQGRDGCGRHARGIIAGPSEGLNKRPPRLGNTAPSSHRVRGRTLAPAAIIGST